MSFLRICRDDVATQSAGEAFALVLRPGDIVALTGGLGAGKTTFVKGVARGLGVVERVTSPSFTLVRQHDAHNELGITTLHHADVYRVESIAEVRDLDLGELVEEAGVVLVEWGELATSVFGRDVLTLSFELVDDEETRTIVVSGGVDAARASALTTWSDS
ncbi:MAG: tRNA (adenosine(37)-N6)-threonylcarbamoyltransferase complex ATPase subunit type 1 TsaE [Acidimicrobiaceae bacterium]|nr:tRNA (adenosine(37)-N6)-threonylcarbamoyltransferase complex ATPase subunit type 1 TsaE [Acidimicrobiaceae bacterium]